MKKLIYFLIPIFAFGCKHEKNLPKVAEQSKLSPIPQSFKAKLLAEADYIDYIYHHLNISASIEDKPNIDININFISEEGIPEIPTNCKPIGRKFINAKGETLATVDVYFSAGCEFYVFVENNKPIYANKISPEGIVFYQRIINSASKR